MNFPVLTVSWYRIFKYLILRRKEDIPRTVTYRWEKIILVPMRDK